MFVLVLGMCAGPARADLWGFIDAEGIARFATTKLDERYQLFFKGGSSLDPSEPPKGNELRSLAAFKQSRVFQRMANHPNVKRFAMLIEQHAKANNLDPALVKAVIAVESSFEPNAVSPKGALGLMQIIPETGARYGVVGEKKRSAERVLLDPAVNIRVGARYLRDLLTLFGHDLTLALAAYNAGERAVQRYDNRVPPFPETQEYVKLVQQFLALYQPPPPPATSTRMRISLQPRRSMAEQATEVPPYVSGCAVHWRCQMRRGEVGSQRRPG